MEIESKTVAREVITTTIVEDEVVVLTLSRDEASALMAVVGKIGGSSSNADVRNVTDKMYQELGKAGLDFWSGRVSEYAHEITQSMRVGPE